MRRQTKGALRLGAGVWFIGMTVAAVMHAQGCAADPAPPAVKSAPEVVPVVTPAKPAGSEATAQTSASASASPEGDPPPFMGATKSGGIFPQQQQANPPQQTPNQAPE